VQGAGLSISLAVMIFVFNSILNSRVRLSARRFIESTGIYPVFYALLSGIVLTAVVLVGPRWTDVSGWASTWALLWALLTVGGIGYLFWSAIGSLDPTVRSRWNQEEVQRLVARATDEKMLVRLAQEELVAASDSYGFKVEAGYAMNDSSLKHQLLAGTTGQIKDINLRRLRRLAKRAKKNGVDKPIVRVSLTSPVRDDTPVVEADKVVLETAKPFWSVETRQDPIGDAVERLHQVARRAIVDDDVTEYLEMAAAYKELLTGQHQRLQQYEQTAHALVAPQSPFEFDYITKLEWQLNSEVHLAVSHPASEVVTSVLNLPLEVAADAIDLGDAALCKKMLERFVGGVEALLRVGAEGNDQISSWGRLRLSEFGSRVAGRLDKARTVESVDALVPFMVIVHYAYLLMTKVVVEGGIKERPEVLADLKEGWDRLLSHWQPERRHPQLYDVELAETGGKPKSDVEKLREPAEQNAHATKARNELLDNSYFFKFVLLFWALHKIREDNQEWLVLWKTFAEDFRDIRRTALAADQSLDEEQTRGLTVWNVWLASEGASTLGATLDIVDTFLILSASSFRQGAVIPDLDVLAKTVSEHNDRLEEVCADPELAPLLSEQIQPQKAWLQEALDVLVAARDSSELKKLEAAPIDQDAVDRFKTWAREDWKQLRVVPALADAVGAMDTLTGEERGTGVRYQKKWSKSFFMTDTYQFSLKPIAQDAALGVSEQRNSAVFKQLSSQAGASPAFEADVRPQASVIIAEMRDDGYAPDVLFIPSRWPVVRSLGLDPRPDFDPLPTSWPEIAAPYFVGFIDGVPVFEFSSLMDTMVFVCFSGLKWTAWENSDDGLQIDIEIKGTEVHLALTDFFELSVQEPGAVRALSLSATNFEN
jgi:hypothetical protein